MHLCIECRHFNAGWSAGNSPEPQCLAPGNQRPDYVTGGLTFIALTAQTCRTNGTLCTPQAVWFEARETPAEPRLPAYLHRADA